MKYFRLLLAILSVLIFQSCAKSTSGKDNNGKKVEIEFVYWGYEHIINVEKYALDITIYQDTTGGLTATIYPGDSLETRISCLEPQTCIHDCDSVTISFPELNVSATKKKIFPFDLYRVSFYWTGSDGKQHEYEEKMPVYQYAISADTCK